jgi:hypothetical protein
LPEYSPDLNPCYIFSWNFVRDTVYKNKSHTNEDDSLLGYVPCSLVEVDRHFRDAYCLHYQGDEALIIALMMEAVHTSETSINFYKTT